MLNDVASGAVFPVAERMQGWVSQLRKGLVELCVMKSLDKSEAYGYQVLQQLNATAGLELTESTLYPVLARLARDRLVSVRSGPSPAGPPRRYYRLTEAGRSRLAEMCSHWIGVRDAVDHLLNGGTHESSTS
jgi:PadR family transcriptional regulator, regulatory protein PadR